MLSAVRPASPSWAERAMEKQPACAAAISSSGLVPTPFSKRVENEYCVFESTPLAVEMVPLPVLRLPCHTADALRCIIPPGIDGSRLRTGQAAEYSAKEGLDADCRGIFPAKLRRAAHSPELPGRSGFRGEFACCLAVSDLHARDPGFWPASMASISRSGVNFIILRKNPGSSREVAVRY